MKSSLRDLMGGGAGRRFRKSKNRKQWAMPIEAPRHLNAYQTMRRRQTLRNRYVSFPAARETALTWEEFLD